MRSGYGSAFTSLLASEVTSETENMVDEEGIGTDGCRPSGGDVAGEIYDTDAEPSLEGTGPYGFKPRPLSIAEEGADEWEPYTEIEVGSPQGMIPGSTRGIEGSAPGESVTFDYEIEFKNTGLSVSGIQG